MDGVNGIGVLGYQKNTTVLKEIVMFKEEMKEYKRMLDFTGEKAEEDLNKMLPHLVELMKHFIAAYDYVIENDEKRKNISQKMKSCNMLNHEECDEDDEDDE